MSTLIFVFIAIVVLGLALAEQAREWTRIGRLARNFMQKQEEQS